MTLLAAFLATIVRLVMPTRGLHNAPWHDRPEPRTDRAGIGVADAGVPLPLGRSARARAYAPLRLTPEAAAGAGPMPALVRPYLRAHEAAQAERERLDRARFGMAVLADMAAEVRA